MHRTNRSLRLLTVVLLLAAVWGTACSTKSGSHTAGPRLSPSIAPGSLPTTSSATAAGLRSAIVPAGLAAPRSRTTGAAIGSDLYVMGGLDAAGAPSADVFKVPVSGAQLGKVTLAGHLSTPTSRAAAVAYGSGILVFGGAGGAGSAPLDLVQLFDPATGATTVAGHLPHPRTDLVALAVGNEMIVTAGWDGQALAPDILATADGASFHNVGSLATPVRSPAATVVGTTVYLFGGVLSGADYAGLFASAAQSYNITTGLSKAVGTLPIPLAHGRAAVLGDQVYVIGGWTPTGPSSAIQRFDVRTGAFTPSGRLPGPVAGPATATIGTALYLAGGMGAQPLADIEIVSAAALSSR